MGSSTSKKQPEQDQVIYELRFGCYVIDASGSIPNNSIQVRAARHWCSNPALWLQHLEFAMNEANPFYKSSVDNLKIRTILSGNHVRGTVSWEGVPLNLDALSPYLLVVDTPDILVNGIHKIDSALRYTILCESLANVVSSRE